MMWLFQPIEIEPITIITFLAVDLFITLLFYRRKT